MSQPRFTVHSSESHYQNSGSSKTALWDLFNPKARRCLPLSLQQNNLINGSGGDTFMFPMQILLRKAINGTYGRREPTKYMGQNKQDDSAGLQGPSPLVVILLEPLPVKRF